jgi:iron complex transport system ATP-binding protein
MKIRIENMDVSIGNKKIVEAINLDLKNKEFIGLIGPNGSGKTTILRAIYRGLKKTKGNIFFDDVPFEQVNLRKSARKLGVMKQSSHMVFDFTVMELALLGRTPYKQPFELDNEKDFELARKAIKEVGMEGYENCSYNNLSGGEQQRAMMACVIAGTHETLLLDELTNHLDIFYQFYLLDIVKNMHAEVLAVKHYLKLGARYCSKTYALKKWPYCGGRTDGRYFNAKINQRIIWRAGRNNKRQKGLFKYSFHGNLNNSGKCDERIF